MKKWCSALLAGLCLWTAVWLGGCSFQSAATQFPPPPKEAASVQLGVPYLSQEGTLPTGCEATSTAMVLQYWGMDISPEEVAYLLPCQELYWYDGQQYGPDPNEYFVGSPFEVTGYGCYAPVIAQTLKQEFPHRLTVKLECGSTIQELYQTYVMGQGVPVLIWATIDLVEPEQGSQWLLETGELFTWKKNEHCMVLVGKQGDRYLCQDPYESHGTLALSSQLLQLRFEQMGSQAVAVKPV